MSNLKGTTWIFNDTIDTTFNFTIHNTNPDNIIINNSDSVADIQQSNNILYYDHSIAYAANSGWEQDGYKTISFVDEPFITSGTEIDFYAWLEANAMQIEDLAGTTWIFNDIIIYPNKKISVYSANNVVVIKCNNIESNSILVSSKNSNIKFIQIEGTNLITDQTWTGEEYKKITFVNDPIIYHPSKEEFILWLKENAINSEDNKFIAVKHLRVFLNKLKDLFATKKDTVLETTLSRGRQQNTTVGTGSFAFGAHVTASGNCSHAEGDASEAIANSSHAEGVSCIASNRAVGSHAEGRDTKTNAEYSHSEGYRTSAGSDSVPFTGIAAHAEGSETHALGDYSHAEGNKSHAEGIASHAEGSGTRALGDYSHAEGEVAYAIGKNSHTEGYAANARGQGSHAEGFTTESIGNYSHAEGYYSTTLGIASHADGYSSIALDHNQHVFGKHNEAIYQFDSNYSDWSTNTNYKTGDVVRWNGKAYVCIQDHTSTNSFDNTYFVHSMLSSYRFLEIVGNGSNQSYRRNARTLDENGNEHLEGDLYVRSTDSACMYGKKVVTVDELEKELNDMFITPKNTITLDGTTYQIIHVPIVGITTNHQLIKWNFSSGTEYNPPATLTCTINNGSIDVTNTSGGGANVTIQPIFAKVTKRGTT